VILRLNWGSHPAIEKLYAYNVTTQMVLARVKYYDGQPGYGEFSVDEIEAIDGDGNYGNAVAEIRRRAKEILNDYESVK
jgi:hypothetical protein